MSEEAERRGLRRGQLDADMTAVDFIRGMLWDVLWDVEYHDRA